MSTDPHQDRIDELFQQAKNLSAAEQARFVDRACRDDSPELRRALEQLLAADQQQRAQAPTGDHVGMGFKLGPQGRDPLIGRRLGAYEVKRFLSKGGFGNVYLGERTDNFRQKVALKLIRPDWVSDPTVLLRFEQERQALADLRHEYIASLLDGGTTEEGWPFLVMEYVDGRPITDYCKEKSLSIDGRLDLFQKVCQAVQHAHNHFYLHRDIKPSNILVTADGVPKLLDFGIAKLFDPLSRQRQVSLTLDHMPLTPEYASPEQVRADRKELGTASDVYSLGVVLYELLTGRLPYNFRPRMHAEIVRVVCEQEPEAPAEVISRPIEQTDDSGKPITTSPDEVSRQRGTSTRGLRKALLGDLELIVLHSLKKEPQRRYARPEDFARDLDNLRRGMPVAARPDSQLYRTKKFLRRHRAACITLSGIALTALILGSTAAVFASRSRVDKALAKAYQALTREVSQASQAARQLSRSPARSLLLAAAAVETRASPPGSVPLPFSEEVLRDSVAAVRGVPLPGAGANVQQVVISPDSTYVAALCADDKVRYWRPTYISQAQEIPELEEWHFADAEFLAGNHLLTSLERSHARAIACTSLGRPRVLKPMVYPCLSGGRPWIVDHDRRSALLPGESANQIRLVRAISDERCDTKLLETDYPVKCWALSADGSLAAAGGNEGQIQLWRLKEDGSAEASSVSVPERPLVALTFTSENLLLAATPQTLWRWRPGERESERLIAISPNGSFSLELHPTAGGGCLLKWVNEKDNVCGLELWDQKSAPGQVPLSATSRVPGNPDRFELSSVRLSPAGRWLVARPTSSQWLHLWDLNAIEKGPAELFTEERTSSHTFSAFVPNETWLAVGTQNGPVQLWGLQPNRTPRLSETLLGHEHAITSLAFDPAGRFLVSGSRAGPGGPGFGVEHPGQVRVWDLSAGSAAPIHPHRLRIQPRANDSLSLGARRRELAFSHDGKWLAVTDRDRTLRVWPALRSVSDALTPAPLVELADVRLSAPDHEGGWILFRPEGFVRWSPSTGERPVLDPPTSPPLVLCAGTLREAPLIAALCENGELLLFDDRRDCVAGQLAQGPLSATEVRFMGFSAAGQPLAVLANHGAFFVRSPNSDGRLPFERQAVEGTIDQVATSGTTVALAQGKNVRLLTINGGAVRDLGSISSLASWSRLEFFPVGTTLVGLNELGVQAWNITDPRLPLFTRTSVDDTHARNLAVGAVSPRLAYWRAFGTIVVTSVLESSAAPPVILAATPAPKGQENKGLSCFLSFARDDSLLIASDYASGDLHLWTLAGLQNGQPPILLEPGGDDQDREIDAIALSPQGDRVAASFAGGAVYVWDLRVEELVKLALQLAGRELDGQEEVQLSGP